MDIGTAQRACRGQVICGDAFVVLDEDECITIALADGLGHGPTAAIASQAFCECVSQNSRECLEDLMTSAHRELSHTRGAAAAIMRIEHTACRMEFLGVGNIELQSAASSPIRPISSPGIVGHNMRKINKFTYEIAGGDLLILYSDGISSRFQASHYQNLQTQEIADVILENHGKSYDDATCLALRF